MRGRVGAQPRSSDRPSRYARRIRSSAAASSLKAQPSVHKLEVCDGQKGELSSTSLLRIAYRTRPAREVTLILRTAVTPASLPCSGPNPATDKPSAFTSVIPGVCQRQFREVELRRVWLRCRVLVERCGSWVLQEWTTVILWLAASGVFLFLSAIVLLPVIP